MHDHRLPLLLLALSLPVTTSYGRVYSLSPHLGDVGGGMRVNLTGSPRQSSVSCLRSSYPSTIRTATSLSACASR